MTWTLQICFGYQALHNRYETTIRGPTLQLHSIPIHSWSVCLFNSNKYAHNDPLYNTAREQIQRQAPRSLKPALKSVCRLSPCRVILTFNHKITVYTELTWREDLQNIILNHLCKMLYRQRDVSYFLLYPWSMRANIGILWNTIASLQTFFFLKNLWYALDNARLDNSKSGRLVQK